MSAGKKEIEEKEAWQREREVGKRERREQETEGRSRGKTEKCAHGGLASDSHPLRQEEGYKRALLSQRESSTDTTILLHSTWLSEAWQAMQRKQLEPALRLTLPSPPYFSLSSFLLFSFPFRTLALGFCWVAWATSAPSARATTSL